MKKIMMALAVIACAVFAQAATVQWKSGTIYTPGAEGGFSTTKAATGSVNAYVWLVSASDYASATADSIIAMDTGTASISGKNNALGGTVSLSDATSFGANDTIYSLVLFSYNDGEKDWVLANKVTDTIDSLGSTKSFANLATAGGNTLGAAGWSTTSVPEPTSGLLLLLGMAGLALKRKCA